MKAGELISDQWLLLEVVLLCEFELLSDALVFNSNHNKVGSGRTRGGFILLILIFFYLAAPDLSCGLQNF